MKIQIPEPLKSDVPQTAMGKLLLVTPVVMTVIATLLAGLASSEMTRAQSDRAYAAQIQSKAGDQWNYFQAKKLRSAMQRNSLELLQASAEVRPFAASALPNTDALAIAALEKNELPAFTHTKLNEQVKAALEAVESSKTDAELAAQLNQLDAATLATALQSARTDSGDFDNSTKPIIQAIDRLESAVASDRALARDFAAARMRFNAARYDAESRLNQAIANLLELQVRKNNLSAERHHKRSGKFFFGMLAAQAAVVVSTFSLAAQKRNFLWSVAAIAGLLAIAFAVYVFLYI